MPDVVLPSAAKRNGPAVQRRHREDSGCRAGTASSVSPRYRCRKPGAHHERPRPGARGWLQRRTLRVRGCRGPAQVREGAPGPAEPFANVPAAPERDRSSPSDSPARKKIKTPQNPTHPKARGASGVRCFLSGCRCNRKKNTPRNNKKGPNQPRAFAPAPRCPRALSVMLEGS